MTSSTSTSTCPAGGRLGSRLQSAVTWVVLADPEGNELCVLRPLTPEELAEP